VKIDPSFIAGLHNESRSTFALVRAIVDLAHHLGLAVTGEGVETDYQFASLRRSGCDAVQGFLLHQPASADHVTALLRRHIGLHHLQSALTPRPEFTTPSLAELRSSQ
jgi:EAL domain-containing protein (putative c-di-GMP-specific phosphodiesterase class I)